jgi:hypothetical protein
MIQGLLAAASKFKLILVLESSCFREGLLRNVSMIKQVDIVLQNTGMAMIQDLLAAASKYKLKSLMQKCEEILGEKVEASPLPFRTNLSCCGLFL